MDEDVWGAEGDPFAQAEALGEQLEALRKVKAEDVKKRLSGWSTKDRRALYDILFRNPVRAIPKAKKPKAPKKFGATMNDQIAALMPLVMQDLQTLAAREVCWCLFFLCVVVFCRSHNTFTGDSFVSQPAARSSVAPHTRRPSATSTPTLPPSTPVTLPPSSSASTPFSAVATSLLP